MPTDDATPDDPGTPHAAPPREARPVALSAVTLLTGDMARAHAFYASLGFLPCAGGPRASFASFRVGDGFLNLMARGADLDGALPGPRAGASPGAVRIILHVGDVDAFHARVLALGLRPHAPPRDAPWGERYFHLDDPDGHALSFARPLDAPPVAPPGGPSGPTAQGP